MKILYVCTHNRCRSILSEAITNHMSNGRLKAYSAGSQPVGEVHPLSVRYLNEQGIPTESLKSKSWDEFEALQPDIVVTVCDSAASEICPLWFGDTLCIHWRLTDPSKLQGSETEVRNAFYLVMKTIKQRVEKLLDLNLEGLSKSERQARLNQLAKEVE